MPQASQARQRAKADPQPHLRLRLRQAGEAGLFREIKLTSGDRKIKQRLDLSILSAELEMTMEGASTLTIQVFDSSRGLLRSQLTREASTILVDDVSYSLVKVSREEDKLTLTFEESAVWLLRQYDEPLKAKRYDADGITRAQFIERMVREVGKDGHHIPFACPEVKDRQPVEAVRETGTQVQSATIRLWSDQPLRGHGH